jgi:hypothetical protein
MLNPGKNKVTVTARRDVMPQRLSAEAFIRKIRNAEEGQVREGLEGAAYEIRLIVIRPAGEAGEFLAPGSVSFLNSADYARFVGEIYDLTDFPEDGAKNRTVKKKNINPERLSARQFIGRLRGAEAGRIQQGFVNEQHEMMLIVSAPEKAAGYFLAPGLYGEDHPLTEWPWVEWYLWYQTFVGEIYRLSEMQPAERKTAILRIKAPYMKKLDKPEAKEISDPEGEWIYS